MYKVLILSVGYGDGHHAAAYAVRDEFQRRGCLCRVVDVCEAASPLLFSWTQAFYQLCVHRLPWLWGVAYAQTGTADWGKLLRYPGIWQAQLLLKTLLDEEHPDVVICTYPLFAYMLDALGKNSGQPIPYALIVTDSLEISRPWMKSHTSLVCVPDEKSKQIVCECYGLPDEVVVATGFPVKAEFETPTIRSIPTRGDCRIVYGAFAPTKRVCCDIRAIFKAMPEAKVTLIAGNRKARLEELLSHELQLNNLNILSRTNEMHRLFAGNHVYIGKAGAATMFEAYASCIPVIVNYALPGQEQGNLQLLLDDKAGMFVDSSDELVSVLLRMLDNDAFQWRQMRSAMQRASRSGGAVHVANEVERRFFL